MARNSRSQPSLGEGRFTNPDGLLTLFADPDGRGDRRWKEMFGFEPRKPPRRERSFIASDLELPDPTDDDPDG